MWRPDPLSGRSSPVSSPGKVDLPEPEAPGIASDSPAPTSRLSAERMVKRRAARTDLLTEADCLHNGSCHDEMILETPVAL